MRGIRFVAFVLLASLAAACGEGGTSEVVIDATPAGIARAVRNTTEGESARFTAEFHMAFAGQEITMTMDGAYDGVGASEAFLHISGLPDEAGAAFGEPVRMLTDGSTMFFCGGYIRALTGAECGSVDLPDLADAGMQTGDPLANLRSLIAAGDVEEVGDEEVDGVDTVHLRGTVVMRDALAELAADDAAAMRAQFETFGADVDAFLDLPIPFEVWIDGDARIRRYTQSWTFDSLVPGGGEMSIDMRLRDFGADIEVELPDPSTVVDLGGTAGFPGN